MAKLRKMLGRADSPYIVALMRLIESQSNATIADWGVRFVEENMVPIYEKAYPQDSILREALAVFQRFRGGDVRLPALKKAVAQVNMAAKAAEAEPAAQAAAKAVSQAIASLYTPTHSLGMAFYGAAAVAYDRVGLEETQETYEAIAAQECENMRLALLTVAIPDEKNPAKINWHC